MAGRIPDETLQEIRDRISLVEVVSSFVNLKKAGQNHLGLCPFHSEKTPSFNVNDSRGRFHCFGCGAHGSAFDFLMRTEHLEFPEAVEQLAKRAGVSLPQRDSDSPVAARREQLVALNEAATRFFQQMLHGPAGNGARQYLAQRGLGAEIVERYGLGFAPSSGSALANWLSAEKLSREEAFHLGLLAQRDDGSAYDRFRGRVMFPIRDRRGRVIAFGGRSLGDDLPKYLNSPESLLFTKGNGLYGLSEAREAIRANDRVVLVEGYMDVLLLVQEGVPYSVAVLGTALTPAQLRLLRPFGGDELTVFFFFDGDTAGRKAAVRAFGVAAEAEVWGRAVFLPQGHDPDSFVREHGREATLRLLERAVPLLEFYLDAAAPVGAPVQQRAHAAEEMAQILGRVENDVRFEILARQAATRLGVSDDVFRKARRRAARLPQRTVAAVPIPAAPATHPMAEVLLLEAMIYDREVALYAESRGALQLFIDPEIERAARSVVEVWQAGGDASIVVESLPTDLASKVSATLLGSGPVAESDRQRIADDCIARMARQALRQTRRGVADELRRAEGSGDEQNAQTELERLNRLLRDGGRAA